MDRPVTQSYLSMIGRRQGRDIMQLGKTESGQLMRWSCSQIKPGSFSWAGRAFYRQWGDLTHANVEFSARGAVV